MMATETGTALGCCVAAMLAAALLRITAHAATAVAALLVSSERGMAKMLLRPAGCGELGCAESPA